MAAQASIRGKAALDASDYATAIKEYTTAIKEAPTSADFYIQRSTAYQRAQKPEEALADAERGVLNAQQRAKKELIIEAQFRRGVSLYKLGRYADAEHILKTQVKEKDPKHKAADMWIGKCAIDLKKLPEDDPRRKCTITTTPSAPATVEAPAEAEEILGSHMRAKNAYTPLDQIRYEWYQNNDNVYFTLFCKGIQKEDFDPLIGVRSLVLSVSVLDGEVYELTLEPLYAAVKHEEAIVRVLPTKAEIILPKVVSGRKWPTIDSEEEGVPRVRMRRPLHDSSDERYHHKQLPTEVLFPGLSTMQDEDRDHDSDEDVVKKPITAHSGPKPTAPAYPTSSKSGPKNWDKITADVDEDDIGGDDGNRFFQKLFKDANPDTRRAMMKSYTESNGTALSTDWDEVKQGKVETAPPDGLVAKSWAS